MRIYESIIRKLRKKVRTRRNSRNRKRIARENKFLSVFGALRFLAENSDQFYFKNSVNVKTVSSVVYFCILALQNWFLWAADGKF